MKKKLTTEEYNSYAAPTCLVCGYLVLVPLYILLFIIFKEFLLTTDIVPFFRIGIFLIGFIILICLFPKIFMLFGFKSHITYRGKGFYAFINLMAVLFPIIGVLLFKFIIEQSVEIDGLLVERLTILECICFFPLIIRFSFFGVKYYIERCSYCGLINTMLLESRDEKTLGTRMEYHDEYGFWGEYKKTVGVAHQEKRCSYTCRCKVCGNERYSSYTYIDK